jgi:hypothetical protein
MFLTIILLKQVAKLFYFYLFIIFLKRDLISLSIILLRVFERVGSMC